jgi:hypothetical protein
VISFTKGCFLTIERRSRCGFSSRGQRGGAVSSLEPIHMHRGPRLCAVGPLWVQTVPSSAVSLSAAMPSWGPGAIVTRDVPNHALVVGNPARQIGWMCKCGERLGGDFVCPVCGVAYQESEKGLEQGP